MELRHQAARYPVIVYCYHYLFTLPKGYIFFQLDFHQEAGFRFRR
jgi:hypothetical protein